ncbi:MAG TPA: hypothetical protein VKN14_02780, partial [Flavobacteriaceae bacterium]|nr:hypothetical protein [Flavobacteriaceae bacterium]
MIEKAPEIEITKELSNSALKIILSNSISVVSNTAKKIESEYLFWDKIKYLNDEKLSLVKTNLSSSQLIWFITKIRREISSKTEYLFGDLLSGKDYAIAYNYNVNDFLQKKLHYLDFNFGAGLQKERLLTDLDK